MCLPGRRSPESLFPPKAEPEEGSNGDEGLAKWVIQPGEGARGGPYSPPAPAVGILTRILELS